MRSVHLAQFAGPVLTPKAMGEADRQTIAAGTDGFALMQRAAKAVVRAICRETKPRPVIVLCGPGNNGGDGYQIATRLAAIGWPVEVAALSDGNLSGDAARARSLWSGPIVSLSAPLSFEGRLVVDALFGTGLKRSLDAEVSACVQKVKDAAATVVSVDIPSGVDGLTGQVLGSAVQADHTITFCCPKPGHLQFPGKLHAGKVQVADIGIPQQNIDGLDEGLRVNQRELWKDKLKVRGPESHKYHFGHTLIACGPGLATGAARLAAISALRAGSGLVSVACTHEAGLVCASHLTEVMIKIAEDAANFQSLIEDKRYNAFVLGPGLGVGERTKEITKVALASGRPTVVDADVLTSFASCPEQLFDNSHENVILTPHEGEFARTFEIKGDRLSRARSAARQSRSVIVLKGGDTIIAGPDGRVAFSPWGTPYLATAGTGDVLAGIIGGISAQGVSAFDAACAGTWLHAAASFRCRGPLIAGDLPKHLSKIRSKLHMA